MEAIKKWLTEEFTRAVSEKAEENGH